MAIADNREAYETFDWIIENADTGFFIITAPQNMQVGLANRYKTIKTAIYDYADCQSGYSFAQIDDWIDSLIDVDYLFILNMQKALTDDHYMLSFNMSRDLLAKKKKAWFFFMEKKTEDSLSTFAYDIYSYVLLKIHFGYEANVILDEYAKPIAELPVDTYTDIELLNRYKKLEKELLELPLNGTPDNQLLSAAITLEYIAQLYKNNANYVDALRILEIVKKIREKILGHWHLDTATTYINIANIHKLQNEFLTALEWNKKALAIYKKTMESEQIFIAERSKLGLANVLKAMGDLDFCKEEPPK
jgi:tetratricopeptide (TPR) repeat protein